jgi:hypothetical protein
MSAAQQQLAPTPTQHPLPYRARLLQKASPRIPTTAEGLPVGLYRVDLLPEYDLRDPQEELQALKNAYLNLSFEYGYPTLSDGRPFWYKLDFEPGFTYAAFQIYLEAVNFGPRDLATVASDKELRRIAHKMLGSNGSGSNGSNGSNSSGNGNTNTGTDAETQSAEPVELAEVEQVIPMLYEASILYAWRARAKAYDLFKEAAYRHMKLRRQSTVEDGHYELSSTLLEELKEKVINKDAFFEGMSPKVAVELLGKLVAIQRVSVGLPAAGPLPNKEAPEDVSFEMIMRSLAQKSVGTQGNVYDHATGQVTHSALNKVLSDPESANMLQEVIIRVTKATHQQNLNSDAPQGKRFLGRGEHEITREDLMDLPYDISGAPGANLDGIDGADASDAAD